MKLRTEDIEQDFSSISMDSPILCNEKPSLDKGNYFIKYSPWKELQLNNSFLHN